MIRAPPRFPLPFAAHRSNPDSARSLYHVARIGMVDQVDSQFLNAIRSDQLRSLGFELRQLQDRDLSRIIHYL
jgi:hypothetical protein